MIDAVYNGSPSVANPTSGNVYVTVSAAPTTVTLTDNEQSANNIYTYGTPVTVTAQVSAPGTSNVPTGTVAFYYNGSQIATKSLTSGSATIQATLDADYFNEQGFDGSVTVQYLGTSNFAASTSAEDHMSISPANTSTALVVTPGFSLYGQPLSLMATVTNTSGTAATPTGNVTFYNGSSLIKTVALGPTRRGLL